MGDQMEDQIQSNITTISLLKKRLAERLQPVQSLARDFSSDSASP
jgi:hypothetical protein